MPPPDQPPVRVDGGNTGIISTGNDVINILVNFYGGEAFAAGALAELAQHIKLEAQRERPVEKGPLATKADELTIIVLSHLKREVEQLRLADRGTLPVHLRPIFQDAPSNGKGSPGTPSGTTGAPLPDLADRLTKALEDSRWLMVLGRAGAGKSVLALQFSKSLAEKRSRDRQGPVPVIFSLGSWNPVTTTLRNWLIGRLERDYSFLAAPGPGPEDTTWATELLDGGNYVLPILDGFDEIAADDGMREEAVKQFNSSTLSLVVTSRPEAINNVRDDSRIRPSAAAIELADLGLDDSLRYLREATATPRDDGTGDVGRLGWRYVLRELSLRPHTRASHDLATVLATPLMTTLARFAYESRVPGHDPSDLLNTEKFSTQDALEEHLLDFFVRTAYKRLLGSRPTSGAKGRPEEPRWGVERPRHWLGYLAVHLTKLGTSDIEWWRLGTAMKLRWVALRVGVTVGIACGLVSGLAYGASTAVGYGLLNGVLAAVITGVTNGTAMGLTFGLMQGFVTKMKVGGPIFEPSRVEIRMHSWTDTETRTRLRKNFLPRTRGGTAGGVLFGLLWAVGVTAVNVSMGNSWGVVVPFAGLLLATATGLGLVLGLIAALGAGFETVIPRKELDSPSDLLITNRATVLKQIITVGLVTGSGYGTLYGLTANSSLSGVWIGLVAGVMVSLGVGTMTAWGRSVVLARIWLPMAGQLPTDLDTFLQDAYARGVLRREGVVYQFRHARLQEYLSNAHQR